MENQLMPEPTQNNINPIINGAATPESTLASVSFKFSNLIKGRVAESLLKTLLEKGGYRVNRFGIEELFAEIQQLDIERYQALSLPMTLRTMPDLLVSDAELTSAYLVEVKYRTDWNLETIKGLHQQLMVQRQYWPDSYAVIMLGKSPKGETGYHQDHIRIITPNDTDFLMKEQFWTKGTWTSLSRIYQVFTRMKGSLEDRTNADLVTAALRELSKLDNVERE